MRLIAATVLFLCATAAVYAQTSDLEQAKSTFREIEQKQQGIVDAAFDRRIKEATRDGDLELITTLKTEQTEFKNSRKLPESTAMKAFGQKYEKMIDGAKKKLADAYTKEIKAKTKAGQLVDAKRLQAELDRLGIAAAAPAKPAAAPNVPAKSEIVVRSAIWKQVGAMAGNQTQDVKTMLQESLEQGRAFEPNQRTLSLLDGRPVGKAVFLDMTIHGVTFGSQLGENSTIRMRAATPGEVKARGLRIGKTRMEALSAIYQTTDGVSQVDSSAAVMTALMGGTTVEVSTRLFGELQFGKPKEAVMLFRIGDTILEIRAAEGTRIGIRY